MNLNGLNSYCLRYLFGMGEITKSRMGNGKYRYPLNSNCLS